LSAALRPGRRRRWRPSGATPFEDPAIAARYESWYEREGRRADRLEKRLLATLLDALGPCGSILDVGSGTGHFTRWFAERFGMRAVGLDLSLEMLRQARDAVRVSYLRADAGALPFADRSFDVVAFVTTLEFVADPLGAVAEAFRVARRGVLVGALNRRSLLDRRRRRLGGPIWGAARPYTVDELRRLVRDGARGALARTVARTTLWPLWPGALPLPWGGFIGLAAAKPAGDGGKEAP
jgi:SAM-dependent methyltransferase